MRIDSTIRYDTSWPFALRTSLAYILVLFVLILSSSNFARAEGADIVDQLQADGFTVLFDFVNRFPDIVALLSNATENTTVFAPSNAAWNSITPPAGETLHQTLLYHLVAGFHPSSVFVNQELVPSLLFSSGLSDQPQVTKVTRINTTEVFINNGQIFQPDLSASNGVIHGIDAVLIPPGSIVDVLSTTLDFSLINQALAASSLNDTFLGSSLTFFAPTNEAVSALAQLNPILLGYLLANDPQSQSDLQKVLKFHASPSVLYAGDIPAGTTSVPTLDSGLNLSVNNAGTQITVDNATVVATNLLASNGVIHAINQVLLPETFDLNLRQVLLGLNLTTLISLVDQAGLASVLNQTTANFTLFAPSNAAFAQLPNIPSGQTLVDVLQYHFTPGQILTTLLSDGTLLPSLLTLDTLENQPQQLKVFRSEDTVGINDANVTNANNVASNGMVHVIDRVLIPPSTIPSVVNGTADLSTLFSLLVAGSLVEPLETTGNLTVFAPVNTAFTALPPAVANYLQTSEGVSDLQNVLSFHVVPGNVVYSPDITTTPSVLPTLNGESITVVRNGASLDVNQATVVTKDILASNGAIQTINSVLIPQSFSFNLRKALLGAGATTLILAIDTAGLGNLLNSTAHSTIFAPSNAAFARNPPPSGQALVDLLLYHVAAGDIHVANLTDGQLISSQLALPSLAGNTQKIKVGLSGSQLTLNGVNVSQADISASNGVVYVLDDVLTEPPSVGAIANASFVSLAAAFDLADVAGLLTSTNNMTLFAPTDAAFTKVPPALLGYLQMDQARADLISVLSYHIVPTQPLYTASIPPGGPAVFPTLSANNATISVTNSDGVVVINGGEATVVQTNLLAANGVVQGIDAVLLPPGFSFTLRQALLGLGATALLDAFNATGLADVLTDTANNHTVFAPTNDAMATLGNVSADALRDILLYQLVDGFVVTADLTDGELLRSSLVRADIKAQPQRIKVGVHGGSSGAVTVNNVNITIRDNLASNGVVQLIDAVLLPPSRIPVVVGALPTLSTLAGLAQSAGVLDTDLAQANLTLLAPDNTAFGTLGTALLTYLSLKSSRDDLVSVLANHVLPDAVLYTPEDVPTTPTRVPTLNGDDIIIERNGSVVTVNGLFTVTVPNILADNGVVHALDGVLLPPGFSFDLRKALLTLNATLFVTLIDKVGLSDLLNGSQGNFTIFAPTNEALESLPVNLTDAQLTSILQYHIAAGVHVASSFEDGELLSSLLTLPALGGRPQQLRITLLPPPANGSAAASVVVVVDNANVTSADNQATNGVVHLLDRVLALPAAIPDVVRSAPDGSLSKVLQLIEAAELESALRADTLSLFAPTDAGIDSVGPAIFNFLLLPAARQDLLSVLTFHVVPNNILYTPDIPLGESRVQTLNGADVVLNKTSGANSSISITVNGAAIVTSNMLAGNGVVQAINALLTPPGFVFNLQRALIGVNATDLLAAIGRAGLDGILNSTEPFTIFAPTNEALASLPANTSVEALADILRYHVVPGSFRTDDLANGQLLSSLLVLPTLNHGPQRLKVTRNGAMVFINDVGLVVPDNMASNGVVHVINKILDAPPDINTVARNTPILSTLVRAIQIVEAQDLFSVPNITALAPSNNAFVSLGAAALGYLLLQENSDTLEHVLSYHLLPNEVLYSPNIPTGTSTFTTATGQQVTIVKTGNRFTVNGATVALANDLASNGVMHILNSVLLPPDFVFTLFDALTGLGAQEFLDAFRLAGLEGMLNGTANFTLFAPTKEAFNRDLSAGVASLSKEALLNLLETHIVEGRFPLEGGMELPTLNNQTLDVGPNATTIAIHGSRVVAHILGLGNQAINGVVFSIDRVLSASSPGGGDGDDDGLSSTWIAVIVVLCVVAVLVLLGVGGFFAYRYWRNRNYYVAIGGDETD